MDSNERPYHKYVFDTTNRKFVGAFEDMYRAEDSEGFDSWQQDEVNHRWIRLALAILADRAFDSILDIGCGKGVFTSQLKTPTNHITGLDISPTAIKKAKLRFPHIDFRVIDVNDPALLEEHIFDNGTARFDLVVIKGVLAYLSNWQDVIRAATASARHTLIFEYVPPNPIGFVKNFDEIKACVSESQQILSEDVIDQHELLLFSEKLD